MTSSIGFAEKFLLVFGTLAVAFVGELGKVSSGTRVLSSSKSFSVHNGEQVVLNCTNTDLHSLHGQVTIAWDKDGVAIPDSDPRLNVRRNGTLLIAHAREKDAGVYKCVTTAKHFLSTDITTFTVLGSDHGPTMKTRATMNHTTIPSTPTRAKSIEFRLLQQQVKGFFNSSSSTRSSFLVAELVNLTSLNDRFKLPAEDLAASLDILVELVKYNSKTNNSALNTSTDHQNVVQVASNLLEEQNAETWLYLQKDKQRLADDLLKAMDDFGLQVGDQLANHHNSTAFILTKNVALRADRLITRKKLNIDFPQYGAKVFFPDDAFANSSTTFATTVVYRTLNDILRLQAEEGSVEGSNDRRRTQMSGSNIVSASVVPRIPQPLRKPIKLVLSHKNKSSDVIGKCVFWEVSLAHRTWETRGCVRVDLESNNEVTACECTHLTIFAVLLNNNPVDSHHDSYLSYISTIGCACSLFFLFLTIFVIATCWKVVKGARVIVLLNLCVAIAVSCSFIIVVEQAHLPKVPCILTAAMLHYSLLCIFTWMLCHGLIFYSLIIKAEMKEKLEPKMKWYHLFGWGLPIVIVTISLAATRAENYAADNCWLSVERGLIYWAFVGPVVTVVSINFILFVLLLCRIDKVRKFRDNATHVSHVMAWLRRTIVLLPVLGITWAFGFLTFISSAVVFLYVFTILNTLQGAFIFINFCVLDKTVREAVINVLYKKASHSILTKGMTTVRKSSAQQIHSEAAVRADHGKGNVRLHALPLNTPRSPKQKTTRVQGWLPANRDL